MRLKAQLDQGALGLGLTELNLYGNEFEKRKSIISEQNYLN